MLKSFKLKATIAFFTTSLLLCSVVNVDAGLRTVLGKPLFWKFKAIDGLILTAWVSSCISSAAFQKIHERFAREEYGETPNDENLIECVKASTGIKVAAVATLTSMLLTRIFIITRLIDLASCGRLLRDTSFKAADLEEMTLMVGSVVAANQGAPGRVHRYSLAVSLDTLQKAFEHNKTMQKVVADARGRATKAEKTQAKEAADKLKRAVKDCQKALKDAKKNHKIDTDTVFSNDEVAAIAAARNRKRKVDDANDAIAAELAKIVAEDETA